MFHVGVQERVDVRREVEVSERLSIFDFSLDVLAGQGVGKSSCSDKDSLGDCQGVVITHFQ